MKKIADSNTAAAIQLNVKRKAGHPVGQSDDLTEDEIQKILSIPDKRKRDELRDYAVLLAFCNTPMRKAELASLNLSNLVDEGKRQYLTYIGVKKRSKKKYWLQIQIEKKVYDGISRYVQSEYKDRPMLADDALFFTLGKHGPYEKRRITPRAIDKIVAKYKRKAGINKRITPHSFRATYVTLRENVPPGTMIKLTGHNDIKSLSPYSRSSRQKVEDAAMSKQFA